MPAIGLVLALLALGADDTPPGQPLGDQLAAEAPEALARAARAEGDARRGAPLFDAPALACARCHALGGRGPALGPDLAALGKEMTDSGIVEAILRPSRSIRKGFETIAVATRDGRQFAGLLAEDLPDALVLKDTSESGKTVRIPKADIDERRDDGPSLMPAGLVNGLASRGQFLDLVRFLIEVHEGGPDRALALRPAPFAPAAVAVPEYEDDLDHAGLIAAWDARSYGRGEAIYGRVCANCHGTKDQPGSLPTAPRFVTAVFKNGRDPLSFYKTLTHGFGQMPPQTWMVPRQKYDVIHYLRESYLKGSNPGQYVPADRAYLAGLPKGTTRGPEPATIEPWVAMDYGSSLMATIEVGRDGSNFAYKGVAVRLDPGPGGVSRGRAWTLYDHDTMRHAASWTGDGFIDWDGINFNGKHQVHPKLVGLLKVANPIGPGWADPATGSFDDPRARGRDGRPYGPLPRSWARYRGLYHHGDRHVLSYTVGTTPVLESPGLLQDGDTPIYTRSFQLGARDRELILLVGTLPGSRATINGPLATLALEGRADPAPPRLDGSTSWEVDAPESLPMTGADFTITARIKTARGGTIFAKTRPGPEWVPDGKALFVRGGRLVFDIGWVGAVTARSPVDDDRWHDVAMTYEHTTGRVRLFVDGRPDGSGALKPAGPETGHVARIGFAAPDFPGPRSYFDGEIAEIRFHGAALDDRAIARDPAANPPLARWTPSAPAQGMLADGQGGGHDARLATGAGDSGRITTLLAGVTPGTGALTWDATAAGTLRLRIAAGDEPLRFELKLAGVGPGGPAEPPAAFAAQGPAADLAALTRGGVPRWPGILRTTIRPGEGEGPFAVDTLTTPDANPWNCQMRLTGLDFEPGGHAAYVCTWDGDVWRVGGIDQAAGELAWKRVASGLFQPLGLKVMGGRVFVTCRDQIAILNDLDGDGESDFDECFNNDQQVTEHFHEFAMGLQADDAGNLYYAKSGRHALKAVVPQHGTLLRVSPDGLETEILATGFRAANGVCVNPDGTFFVTDQEGFWLPKNRLNWVRPGRFYGNLWGYTDVTDPSDSAMEPPIAWITNRFDRSPGEMLRVEGDRWGLPAGTLLNLSYGEGKIFVVPHEQVGDQLQGGMAPLPIDPLPTGVMRGRFHPGDGQLYACGMYAWAGNRTAPGGLYRIRATGRPGTLPVGLHARPGALDITFTQPLDRATAADPSRYEARVWGLRRSERYGSDHIDEHALRIAGATVAADGRTVSLALPDLAPTMGMEILYHLRSPGGEPVDGAIHNSIHQLGTAVHGPR